MLSLLFHVGCTGAADSGPRQATARERRSSRAATTAGEPTSAALAVPAGRSWLCLPSDDRDTAAISADPAVATASSVRPIALEMLDRPDAARIGSPGGAALLAAVPESLGARLNGLPAPPLALLQPGDRLEVPGGPVLHLLLHVRPEIGPPPPAAVGTACPVCRTPVTAETRVYLCRCGAAIHAEDASRPAAERLECALLSTLCAACQQPIHRQEITIGAPEP